MEVLRPRLDRTGLIMPKQLLPHDVTSAERHSGCVWASRFRSAADEIDKGGVITGTPVFERTRGVTLDGTTDYVTYGLNGQLNLGTIGIHCLFWPAFDYDEDANLMLFCSQVGQQYSIAKLNNANSNFLQLYLGNTMVENIQTAAYAASWVANGRNVLSIAGTTGNTSAWLNGTQILTADATAWTAAAPTALAVGAVPGGTSPFSGRIESLHIFDRMDGFALDHARIWEGGGA